jgi:hypothetical protein
MKSDLVMLVMLVLSVILWLMSSLYKDHNVFVTIPSLGVLSCRFPLKFCDVKPTFCISDLECDPVLPRLTCEANL